jgi:cyanuric acid amidohydrolase
MSNQETTTAIDALRVVTKDTRDVSDLVVLMKEGRLNPDDVIAVTGKTAGWGPSYGASRIDADHAVRRFLLDHGTRSAADIDGIPMAFSAGVGTILTPHLVVFTRTEAQPAEDGLPRLAVGTGRSPTMLPEWIGTTMAVTANADAVISASADAQLRPQDVEYVVGKAYFPTREAMGAARVERSDAPDFDDATLFRLGSGSAALGVGTALDGFDEVADADIARNAQMWSGKVAISANAWEDVGGGTPQTQLMVLGNKPGAGGRLRVGHAVVKDLLDVDAVPRALRRAGLDVGDGPLKPDVAARVVAVYMKANETVMPELRGRRQIIDDPAYAENLKTVLASAFAAMLQDNLIWISGGGVQQGPPGGGTLAIIVDVGEA